MLKSCWLELFAVKQHTNNKPIKIQMAFLFTLLHTLNTV